MNIELAPDGGFTLSVPSASGTHPISIPFSEKGLRLLRHILTRYERAPKAKIGNTSSPTQYMVEQWLKQDAERKREEAAEAHAKMLEELSFDMEIIL